MTVYWGVCISDYNNSLKGYKDGEECLEKVLKRSVIFSWGMFLNDCFTYIIIKYEEEHKEKTKFIAKGMVSGEGLLTYMMT